MTADAKFTSLLQTQAWADFKSRHGWRAHTGGEHFFLERSLPLGQHFIYAPELPLQTSKLKQLAAEATRLGRAQQAFAVRLEFLAEWSESVAHELKQLGFVKSFEEVQPEFRQWIDLRPTLDEILAAMKPKGRYNIRVAERHGVQVTESDDIDIFYRLAITTAKRDGFTIRSRDYYADLLKTLQQNNLGALYVATLTPDTPLAAAIISFHDNISSYLYGASSSDHRESMAPYLLHWHIMQEAKKRSCTIYDLLAVAPPSDTQHLTPNTNKLARKYAGITRFKSQFGGQTVHLIGSWDLILKPAVYTAYKLLETIRR